MTFIGVVGIIAGLYISSKVFEQLFDLFILLPGFLLLGLFISFLNSSDLGETLMWTLGVPLFFFAIKPA